MEEPAQAETTRQMPTLPIAKIEKMEEPAQAETPRPILTLPIAMIEKLEEPEQAETPVAYIVKLEEPMIQSPLMLGSRTVPEMKIGKLEKAPEGRGRRGNRRTAQPKLVLPLPSITIDLLHLKTEWTDGRETWKIFF